ncbi:hypothetical protein NX059_006144 [Plenodomus lindquistii]|nr:hypothetical protein NX059_006144 [Plenodomus lindquistii]
MGDATITRLSATPWAASLINDPKWTAAETPSRIAKPTGEDSFFAETLSTDRTMRACLTLRPTQAINDDWPYREIVTLVEIGEGLNGWPRIIHGGMAATLLDEVSGVLLQLNTAAQVERLKHLHPSGSHVQPGYFTAYLNTSYRLPVPTPGVVLCTAKFERIEGRKVWLRSTIEDGAGTVFTVGEAMFIEMKNKL